MSRPSSKIHEWSATISMQSFDLKKTNIKTTSPASFREILQQTCTGKQCQYPSSNFITLSFSLCIHPVRKLQFFSSLLLRICTRVEKEICCHLQLLQLMLRTKITNKCTVTNSKLFRYLQIHRTSTGCTQYYENRKVIFQQHLFVMLHSKINYLIIHPCIIHCCSKLILQNNR